MEKWMSIIFETGYEINEFGKVRNIKTGLILKTWYLRNGYEQVQIRKNVYTIHRLVAKVFLHESEFEGGLVLHLDDNPKNNHFLNLKWGTSRDNILMSYAHGRRSKKGENHHLAKFTLKEVEDIRKRLNLGERVCEISREFKVCHQTISNIKQNKSWI